MKNFLLIFIMVLGPNFANASFRLESTNINQLETCGSDVLLTTRLHMGKISVSGFQCQQVTISKDVAEAAGYSLGELQKLILDYSTNEKYQVTLKVVTDSYFGDVKSVDVNTVSLK